MKRTIATSTVDVAVVGGGILGASIACRAAQAGFTAALIDKGDFASAASANSLKIIDSGIRFLPSGNIKRMRESIRSRREMMRLFPHLARPLPCLAPIYGHGTRGREIVRAALMLYDLIAWDRNAGLAGKNSLPRGGWLSPANTTATIPGLDSAGLTGGALWREALAIGSERLVLEYIKLAVRHGAMAANYCAMTEPLIDHGRLHGFFVRDALTGAEQKINCRALVMAAGPGLEDRAGKIAAQRRWATAINLVVKKRFFGDYAVSLAGPDSFADPYKMLPQDKRRFLFAPWRDAYTLIGTRYSRWSGKGDFLPSAAELAAELAETLDDINRAYPAAALTPADVSFFHAALVPIAPDDDGFAASPPLAKNGHFIDHTKDGAAGLISVLSGQYTAAPALAERVLRHVRKNYLAERPRENRYQAAASAREKLDFAPALAALGPEYEKIRAHLTERYGEGWREVFWHLAAKPEEAASPWLVSGSADLGCAGLLRAELRYFIEEEMALTLADVVFRRANIAGAECPARGVLATLARAMAGELGWNEAEAGRQIEKVLAAFAPLTALQGDNHATAAAAYR
jgi:glycerol-3-phosphate dehydrogenase